MELSKQEQIIQKVITEAWNNPSFKKELIASPIEAIKKLTGEQIEIPKGKTIQVFDQSKSNVICLNIPPQPSLKDVELRDDQLEAVAGGCFFPYPFEGLPGGWKDLFPKISKKSPEIRLGDRLGGLVK